ncbi:MAG: type IV pilus twitching motility protein PilT [candidate division Zixibacteria bacterium]|nr:type IV pilus twitching motility protein PilT [candidate division Zixibacteria bacterium]
MPKIDQLLDIVKKAGASDLHLAAESEPLVRVAGSLQKTRHKKLDSESIRSLIYEILTDDQIRRFEKEGDLDISYGVKGIARFRINVFHAYRGVAAAVRLIPDRISTLDTLGFPESVGELVQARSGLMLVTGPTNSGKTTTLAALIDHINTNFSRHIISLEDPVEYVHENKNSLVTQRQIGLHAGSFSAGLRAALREDPDVVVVGELRDPETISLAITAAEVGLLVLGTLHTNTAANTIDRIIDVFPADQQQQIRVMLANSLLGVISQQLVQRADKPGRVAAYELLVRTNSIAHLIREGKTHQIPNVIQSSRKLGMRQLDSHLKALVDSGIVNVSEAVRVAADPSQFCERALNPDKELVETT